MTLSRADETLFTYRISSNKRRGVYSKLQRLSAAFIRGRRLLEGGV